MITPALMTGAFADRFRFKPYLAFIALWLMCPTIFDSCAKFFGLALENWQCAGLCTLRGATGCGAEDGLRNGASRTLQEVLPSPA